jgi:hypothetical protein
VFFLPQIDWDHNELSMTDAALSYYMFRQMVDTSGSTAQY